MQAIKGNRSWQGKIAIPHVLEKLKNDGIASECLDGLRIAIPVPGSGIRRRDSLWVPMEICKVLLQLELVSDILPCLERVKPVSKSSSSTRGNRSDPIDHFNSIEITELMPNDMSIVLVDDVITRGATIAGCAAKLMENESSLSIVAFSVIRTMGLGNFSKVVDPAKGTIKASHYRSDRDP